MNREWVRLGSQQCLGEMKGWTQSRSINCHQEYHVSPFIWWRYIDDILMIWTRSVQDLNTFTSFLNNIYPTIKFTCDFFFTSIPFLDVNVSLQDDGKIIADLYTKLTDKNRYLLYIRHVIPYIQCTKRAMFFSVAFQSWFRLRRIWSTNKTFTLRTNELIDYLYKRGYNRYFLQRKYNELTISHGQKHLCPMTLPHWTKQNVFPSLSPTTQRFVPSRPLLANTFTSLFHPHVAITSLKLHPL